jgi:tRNA A37 threonylcarbamoyltransferase TsaD
VDFVLCRREKSELANLSLSQESFKTNFDGVVPTVAKDDFARAFTCGG